MQNYKLCAVLLTAVLNVTSFTWLSCAGHRLRASSAPYISGDTFRCELADNIFDETNFPWPPNSGKKVKSGNVVFVKTDLLEKFFAVVHPTIKCRYILLTHNAATGIPGSFSGYLNDDKIIAWFGQNVSEEHPKLHPIPLGCANRYWPHGNIKKLDAARKNGSKLQKKYFLYMNFKQSTYPDERTKVYELFKNKSYCFTEQPKPFEQYLEALTQSYFVLSPRGRGVDCHRTWEALYMGAIPIVGTSSLDQLYEGLPILIVKDWGDVNEEFLQKKYQEFQKRVFNLEKLTFDYWKKEIEKVRTHGCALSGQNQLIK